MKKLTNGLITTLTFGLAALSSAAITFTQTVDGWWLNTYTWAAQVENVQARRTLDPVGTVKPCWIHVKQMDGSKAATAVYCTTMTKTFHGAFTSRWDVNVHAGTITDDDWWDADELGSEIGRAHV